MKNTRATALAITAFLTCVSSANAQAWRNCIQNSIGPGGCELIGPEAVSRLLREGPRQSAREAVCRSVLMVASPLGQAAACRSGPAAGSGLTEIGTGDSDPRRLPNR